MAKKKLVGVAGSLLVIILYHRIVNGPQTSLADLFIRLLKASTAQGHLMAVMSAKTKKSSILIYYSTGCQRLFQLIHMPCQQDKVRLLLCHQRDPVVVHRVTNFR